MKTLAGNGQCGWKDGPLMDAEFVGPASAVVMSKGVLFVVEGKWVSVASGGKQRGLGGRGGGWRERHTRCC